MPRRQKQHSEGATTSEVVSLGKVATTATERTRMSDEVKSLIEYDTDLAEAEAPVPLPPGDYAARIRGAEIKTSQKGNPYVSVTFFIDPEQYPADYTEGDPDGTILSFNRLNPDNTQRARWGMKRFCEAIGAEMGSKLDLNDWLDKSAIVTVAEREYEGVKQAEIKKVGAA